MKNVPMTFKKVASAVESVKVDFHLSRNYVFLQENDKNTFTIQQNVTITGPFKHKRGESSTL